MELEYRASFVRDLRRVRNAVTRGRVLRVIEELEAAPTIAAMPGAVRITAAKGRYYRMRIGDFRLGIAVEGNVAVLVRFLHRRDIYRYFPGGKR